MYEYMQRLMASAFSDSLMEYGGRNTPLRSREPPKVWLWKFYYMLVNISRHEIKKKFWHNLSGLYITGQNPEKPDFWKYNF